MSTKDRFYFKINCTQEEVIHFTISSPSSILSGITTFIGKDREPDVDENDKDYESNDLYFAVPAKYYESTKKELYYGVIFFNQDQQIQQREQNFDIVATRKRPDYFNITFNEPNPRLYYFQHKNTYLYFKFEMPPMHYASLTLWELEHPVYDNLFGIVEYVRFHQPASDEYKDLNSFSQGEKPYVSLPAVYGNNSDEGITVFYTMKYLDYTYQEYLLDSILKPLPWQVQQMPISLSFINQTHGLYYHILVKPKNSVIVQTTGVSYFNYIPVKSGQEASNASLIFPTQAHHEAIANDVKHRFIYTNDQEDIDIHMLILVTPAPFSKVSDGSVNYIQIRHVNNTFSVAFIGGIIAFVVFSAIIFLTFTLAKHNIHRLLPKSSQQQIPYQILTLDESIGLMSNPDASNDVIEEKMQNV